MCIEDLEESFDWMKKCEDYCGIFPQNIQNPPEANDLLDKLATYFASGLNNVVQHARSLKIKNFESSAECLMDLLDKWIEHDYVNLEQYGGQKFHYFLKDEDNKYGVDPEELFNKVKTILVNTYNLHEN